MYFWTLSIFVESWQLHLNSITNFKRNHIDKDVIVEFLIDTRSTTNILNMETFGKVKEDVRVALNPTK